LLLIPNDDDFAKWFVHIGEWMGSHKWLWLSLLFLIGIAIFIRHNIKINRQYRKETEEDLRKYREAHPDDPEPPPLWAVAGAALLHVASQPSVVVTKNGSVAYETTGVMSTLNRDEVEKQIKEILDQNPDADLKKLGKSLGVKIINVQKSRRRSDGGIYIDTDKDEKDWQDLDYV
jgi:flagellar biosynthesis/type III secretory pathway M-ring protein FliF/YscJ